MNARTLRFAMSFITGSLTGVAIAELNRGHLATAIGLTLAVAVSVFFRCLTIEHSP
jgi:hypothetical protein